MKEENQPTSKSVADDVWNTKQAAGSHQQKTNQTSSQQMTVGENSCAGPRTPLISTLPANTGVGLMNPTATSIPVAPAPISFHAALMNANMRQPLMPGVNMLNVLPPAVHPEMLPSLMSYGAMSAR